ncbi:hypothetical protein L6452_33915 [Arctium lappa]|uniref:Uncharacterized protein n=1 Tax=Arctium lappa TaxID=4217 RepID=A0ACB8YHZ6_ARCLA|nr:hypothetical protein L6452_33915 [Arctium lappa]
MNSKKGGGNQATLETNSYHEAGSVTGKGKKILGNDAIKLKAKKGEMGTLGRGKMSFHRLKQLARASSQKAGSKKGGAKVLIVWDAAVVGASLPLAICPRRGLRYDLTEAASTAV